MPAPDDRVLQVTAHGRRYRMYDNADQIAGAAAAKTARLMRLGQPYERPLLEHIYRLDLTGTAIDVGANVGNHTLWFAVVCGLRVVAFEPLVHEQLVENLRLNGLADTVEVAPVAAGDWVGTARHLGDGFIRADSDAEIPVRPIDDFGVADVAVVKVDVEGMEPAVLRGAEQTIRRDRPVIFAEEWDTEPSWHDAIAAVLEPWGYEMTYRFTGREAATPVGKWEHTG